jgi:hypothetical protein
VSPEAVRRTEEVQAKVKALEENREAVAKLG